jgi:sugar O-acyltransferase (sialic acid O-acetyltransferase NeuD family)
MTQAVMYGTGSSLIVDIEESLFRSNITLCAAIYNRETKSYLSEGVPLYSSTSIPDHLKALAFIVPFFTPGDRQQVVLEAESLGFLTPLDLIDSSVAAPRSLVLGGGVYVNAGCSLGARSELDAFVLVNRGVSLGHHVHLGRFVSVGPGAVIAGWVNVGKGSVVGSGAVILPNVTIGENSVIGAGAVVTRDVSDNCLAVGNPARIAKTGITGFKDQMVH